MAKRPTAGRALFYTRDSGGRHETTPGQYVLWASKTARERGLAFDGTPARIAAMIREGRSRDGDIFLDYGVTGNTLSRSGLDALIRTALEDQSISHVLIPRRDRLARPDYPIDGMELERRLREGGLALVFMDLDLPPSIKGRRGDLGEMINAMVAYNHAGEFRRDLAQKMIHAQTALAKAGYSTGGRPPYGFRRWLVRLDGTAVRELAEGEHVRMAGHHVAWLPGPEAELEVIRRILSMLETMPASRVAAMLTREGVPTPDAGRRRTDRGINHPTSGVWHQPTIVNLARNPLLLAVAAYGRRSMGDQLRFSPDGPRPLEDEDRRQDGRPKVVANPKSDRIQAEAKFQPLVDPSRQSKLLSTLDARAGTQRGKAALERSDGQPAGRPDLRHDLRVAALPPALQWVVPLPLRSLSTESRGKVPAQSCRWSDRDPIPPELCPPTRLESELPRETPAKTGGHRRTRIGSSRTRPGGRGDSVRTGRNPPEA